MNSFMSLNYIFKVQDSADFFLVVVDLQPLTALLNVKIWNFLPGRSW
jgi:hypothetical protein